MSANSSTDSLTLAYPNDNNSTFPVPTHLDEVMSSQTDQWNQIWPITPWGRSNNDAAQPGEYLPYDDQIEVGSCIAWKLFDGIHPEIQTVKPYGVTIAEVLHYPALRQMVL